VSQDGETVGVRQAQVEHHQVELTARRVLEALACGPDRVAREPRCCEALGDERRDPCLVLHDQDLGHCSFLSSSASCWAPLSSPPARPAWWGRGTGPGVAGRSIVNVEPTPGTDSTRARPPCAWAIAETIARPRPAPSCALRPRSPRTNRSN